MSPGDLVRERLTDRERTRGLARVAPVGKVVRRKPRKLAYVCWTLDPPIGPALVRWEWVSVDRLDVLP